jgi:hypothetical protein
MGSVTFIDGPGDWNSSLLHNQAGARDKPTPSPGGTLRLVAGDTKVVLPARRRRSGTADTQREAKQILRNANGLAAVAGEAQPLHNVAAPLRIAHRRGRTRRCEEFDGAPASLSHRPTAPQWEVR